MGKIVRGWKMLIGERKESIVEAEKRHIKELEEDMNFLKAEKEKAIRENNEEHLKWAETLLRLLKTNLLNYLKNFNMEVQFMGFLDNLGNYMLDNIKKAEEQQAREIANWSDDMISRYLGDYKVGVEWADEHDNVAIQGMVEKEARRRGLIP